jgi:hypothetical protein
MAREEPGPKAKSQKRLLNLQINRLSRIELVHSGGRRWTATAHYL